MKCDERGIPRLKENFVFIMLCHVLKNYFLSKKINVFAIKRDIK